MTVPLVLLLACAGPRGGGDDTGPPADTACTPTTWALDLDGDGWAGDQLVEQCEAPAQHAEQLGDCDDGDAGVHPAAAEVCDGVDNDCDGVPDPPEQTWYTDADGDGYGDPLSPVTDCAQPAEAVSEATDCDDTRADTWPGAPETWYDGVDQDCGGGDDLDADGDGEQSDEHGGVDCADWDAARGTFAAEVCGDYVDEDCDGVAAACPLDPLLTFDDADVVIEGERADTYYGWTLSIARGAITGGDALVVSEMEAEYRDGDEVHVYRLSGGVPERLATITSDGVMPGLGYVIHDDGDYTGDGVPDLGLWVAEAQWKGVEGPGRVYVFSSPVYGDISVQDADLHVGGSETDAWFGHGLSTAFAWEDGVPLLAAGAPGSDWSDGLTTEHSAGRVVVLDSRSESVSADDPIAALECDSEECWLGDVVLAADVDSDGVDDLLTRARYLEEIDGNSMVGVFLGPLVDTRPIQDADGGLVSVRDDRVGRLMEAVGDIDDDGVEDFLIPAGGCELYDDRGGCMYLYSGAALAVLDETGVGALATVAGLSEDDSVGILVSHGDVDADGSLDLLSAQDENSETAEQAGRVWLWYGPLAGTRTTDDADVEIEGSGEEVFLGYDLSSTGDLDGDGCDDIATSEVLWSSEEHEHAGRVGVWFGPCL